MNKILRYVVLSGVFLIPFIPLVIANSLFFPYITGKGFAFRILVEILFGAWTILAVTDPRYRPKKSWIYWSLAIFMIVMFIADLQSIYPYKSFWSNYERMEGYITLIHLFALFIIAATVLVSERSWKWFWNTSIVVSLIIAVYGFLQLAGKIPITQGAGRVDGTFGNATYMAVYAMFHIFITAYVVVSSRMSFAFIPDDLQKNGNKWLKVVIGAVIIVIQGLILYMTETRGTMLGLIGGVGLSALLIAIFDRGNKTIRRISVGVIVLAIAVVLGFLAVKNTSFVKKSSTLSRFASISLSDNTTKSRIILWQMAFKGFEERPILGWGQESFNYVFNKYYDPKLYNQEQWFDRTHNVFFDWLIAGGILGLGAYLWFFGATIWCAWKNESFTVPEKSIFVGLLVGYFIHNLFVFDNLTSYLLFFMVAAYIHVSATRKDHPAEAFEYRENRVIAPVAAVVTIFVLYFVNYAPLMANMTLINAMSNQSSAAKLGLQSPDTPFGGDVTQNIAEFQKAIAYGSFGTPEAREQVLSAADTVSQYEVQNQTTITSGDALVAYALGESKNQAAVTPSDARYQVLVGILDNRTSQYADGIPYLEKARDLSPKKQSILFELGTAYIGAKRYADAENIFKTAYELDTSDDQAKIYYAISTIYAGDDKTTSALIQSMPRDTVLSNDQIVYAYYSTGKYDKVLTIWKARVAANPNDAQMHLSLAAAYILVKDQKDAIAEIQAAIKLNPDFKTQGEQYIEQIKAGKTPQ